jgi:PAS domain S-box-containing protein
MQHDSLRHDSLRPGLEGCIEAFDAELAYVHASLRRLGARPEEIEGLAHQVFLLLVPTWPTFARRRPLALHLFSLAVQVVVRHRRRLARTRAQSTDPIPLSLAALDRIPLKDRAVLVLSELDQISLPQIAESLSMTRLGVALRLRTARRKLHTAIRQLAADWWDGRFGNRDLLLGTLGLRPEDFAKVSALSEGLPQQADDEHPPKEVAEIFQLQDDIFLLEVVMDDLPGTIYFKDRQSRFTHINRYAAAHYGIVDPVLAIGRTDFDFFTDEHAGQALRDEQEIIRTGRPLVSVEERETLPDGELRRVQTTKLPLHDRGGEIVGTFGLSRDLTEQRATR